MNCVYWVNQDNGGHYQNQLEIFSETPGAEHNANSWNSMCARCCYVPRGMELLVQCYLSWKHGVYTWTQELEPFIFLSKNKNVTSLSHVSFRQALSCSCVNRQKQGHISHCKDNDDGMSKARFGNNLVGQRQERKVSGQNCDRLGFTRAESKEAWSGVPGEAHQ